MRYLNVLVAFVVAVLIVGCQKETSSGLASGKSDLPKINNDLLREAEERTRIEKERLRVAEDQKRLAEEQLRISKRIADEQYVQGEVESKRKELRLINENAMREALRLGIDPATVPMLDEASVIGKYEKDLRKIKGLD